MIDDFLYLVTQAPHIAVAYYGPLLILLGLVVSSLYVLMKNDNEVDEYQKPPDFGQGNFTEGRNINEDFAEAWNRLRKIPVIVWITVLYFPICYYILAYISPLIAEWLERTFGTSIQQYTRARSE